MSTRTRILISLLSLGVIILTTFSIAAIIVSAIGLNDILSIRQIEIVTGLYQNLPSPFSPSQIDTTLVVIACTNNTVSGTNDVIKHGKVMFANTCGIIEDNTCQEYVCPSSGICTRRIITGGECAEDAQCVDLYGPGYVCDISSCLCEVMVPVNGSMYTNSLVCNNTGTLGVVVVMNAQCPMPGQVLTAIDSSSADWEDPNREIPCDTGDVVVSNATCPSTGQVLTATSSGTANWEDPNREIPCNTGNVVISNATCPVTGQVLTAKSSGTADWEDPNTYITCATGTIIISNATCPTTGQVLTATSSGTADWENPGGEIPCATGEVVVSNATCPTTGQVLTATGTGTATWQTSSSSQTTTSGVLAFPAPWSNTMSYTATATGNVVSVTFESIFGTPSAASTAVTTNGIAVGYRPASAATMLYPVTEIATSYIGILTVSSTGIVTISRSTLGGSFAGGGFYYFGQGFLYTITYQRT